jgi:hypothetical protein
MKLLLTTFLLIILDKLILEEENPSIVYESYEPYEPYEPYRLSKKVGKILDQISLTFLERKKTGVRYSWGVVLTSEDYLRESLGLIGVFLRLVEVFTRFSRIYYPFKLSRLSPDI